jgi:UDP-glucuronate 4-epimerase
MGLDNINDYYDVNLKYSRLESQGISKESIRENSIVTSATDGRYRFLKADLADHDFMVEMMRGESFDN